MVGLYNFTLFTLYSPSIRGTNSVGYTSWSPYVIVLEKRDHFAVKLYFQYRQTKEDTQLGFVHNFERLNQHNISGLERQIFVL